MSTVPTATAGVTRYRIVLPPGWAVIPLRSGTDEAIQAILLESVAGFDEDSAERCEQVAAALHRLSATARDTCGRYLYLPVAAVHGVAVAASFVVADVTLGAVEQIDPALLVAGLAGDPNAARVRIGGAGCVRTERVHAAEPARGVLLPYRRVDYLVPFVGDPDRWLVVTFSAVRLDEAEDPSTRWVEVFDAIMATFHWHQEK